jgi:hypothetical protein
MVSVQADDRGNARAFAALLRDKPWLHLNREVWPQIPDPWPEGETYTGPFNADMAESPVAAWPGSKAPECYVWLGVLNNSDLDRVRDLFSSIPWCIPNSVQLLLMDQEEFYFRLWMFRSGRLRQFAPTEPNEDDEDFWVQNHTGPTGS